MRRSVLLVLSLAIGAVASARDLDDRIGRTEVRLQSNAFPLLEGRTPAELRLPERLERLGYERVRERPTRPGQYFHGTDRFWVFRREHRQGGAGSPGQAAGPGAGGAVRR